MLDLENEKERVSAATLEAEELHYGKLVIERGGPVNPSSDYAITHCSEGITKPNALVPRQLIDRISLAPSHIERDFGQRGALVFRAVDIGVPALAGMRLRFRSEAGEGETGRSYQQTSVIALPDVKTWADVPPGFFSWCATNLEAEPDLQENQARSKAKRQIVLPALPVIDIGWLDGQPDWRKFRIANLLRAVESGVPHRFGTRPDSNPSGLDTDFAADLDVIATLRLDQDIHEGRGLAITIGLDSSIAADAITFTSAQIGEATSSTFALAKLRMLVADASVARQTDRTARSKDQKSSFFEQYDNRGRRIGQDPIVVRSRASARV